MLNDRLLLRERLDLLLPVPNEALLVSRPQRSPIGHVAQWIVEVALVYLNALLQISHRLVQLLARHALRLTQEARVPATSGCYRERRLGRTHATSRDRSRPFGSRNPS